MNRNQYPIYEDRTDSDLEASSGLRNQERIVDGMDDPEYESGRYYSEHDDYDPNEDKETKDPLAGDVDKFVHPDETRADEQIARDVEITNRLHMSGDDGADEYWADYDKYFGTVNGGQSPDDKQKGITEDGTYRLTSEDLVDKGKYTIATEKLSDDELKTGRAEAQAAIPGTPEWHKAHIKTVVDVDGNEHRYFDLNDSFKGMSDTEIAASMRESKIKRDADEKHRAYYEELYELEQAGKTEDPLAGDVDRWVDPSETRD